MTSEGRTLPLCGSTRGGSLPCPNTAPCPIHPKASGRTTSCKDAVVTVLPPSRDWPRAFSWHCRDCDKWGERHYDREQDAKAAVTRHLTTPARGSS